MKITFNSKELESRLAKAVNLDQFDLALKIGARDIEERAKGIHKYTTRTGNLDNSIVTTHAKLVHKVGIDTRTAKYGTYQHDGTRRGIKADPFIHRAWKIEKQNILNQITKTLRQYI